MPAFKMENGEVTKVGLWHGTVIKDREGRRFKVTKLNPVNIKMMDESGQDGWQLNREVAERLIDEDQSWDGPKEKTEYQKLVEAIDSGITLGTAVKITEARYRDKYPDTYVVVACRNDGTFRMAKLGGDGGRYLRGFRASDLEVVKV